MFTPHGEVSLSYEGIKSPRYSLSKEVLGRGGGMGWGSWVAELVKRPTLAQVMISQFVGSSPASGSVLTAWSLEPASDSVSPHLSLCPSPACTLSLSLSQK